MNVPRNTAVRSNTAAVEKATRIKYPDGVLVNFVTQDAMRMKHTICSLSGSTYYSTISHKWHDFRGGNY